MGRRTISNLSRELKVSRPCIYRAIERLGLEKKAGESYPLEEWEALKQELKLTSEAGKQKRDDTKKFKKALTSAAKATAKQKPDKGLSEIATSTLQDRLNRAKQEYDFTRRLIMSFQAETDAYYEMHGKTTIMTNNGAMGVIPSITNLEKFVKLNIALSKLITDLESDLDLEGEGADDPFA